MNNFTSVKTFKFLATSVVYLCGSLNTIHSNPQEGDRVEFDVQLENLKSMMENQKNNKIFTGRDNKKVDALFHTLESIEKRLKEEEDKGSHAVKAKIMQYKDEIVNIKKEIDTNIKQGFDVVTDEMVGSLLHKTVNNYLDADKNMAGQHSVFRDEKEFNAKLVELFQQVKQAAHVLSEGELDEESLSIQSALQAFFTAMENIRAYIQKNTLEHQSWLNNPDAFYERAHVKYQFQRLDKRALDSYVKDLKLAQKKMNSKFGFLSAPLLKSSHYKIGYNELKKIADAVNSMIANFDKEGLYKSLKELNELMK